MWSFIARNWDAVNERFPSNSIVRMLEGITALADETVAADVQAFFAEHEVPQGAKQLTQHLERQRAAVALRARGQGRWSPPRARPRLRAMPSVGGAQRIAGWR